MRLPRVSVGVGLGLIAILGLDFGLSKLAVETSRPRVLVGLYPVRNARGAEFRLGDGLP